MPDEVDGVPIEQAIFAAIGKHLAPARANTAFMERLAKRIEEDKPILDRLEAMPHETVERERREILLAFPKFTLLRIGWEIGLGRVQGGIYYRIGDGLGPTGRDTTARDNLNRAVRWGLDYRGQKWGVEVLATPNTDGC